MSWNTAAAGTIAAEAPASARVAFIRKTYLHLGGAVLAFIAVEAALITSPLAQPIVQTLLGGRMSWLIVPAAFMAVGMGGRPLGAVGYVSSDAVPGSGSLCGRRGGHHARSCTWPRTTQST